jgi:uncharacterized protein YukE
MAFEGADPEQLDSLADQFHLTAQRLEDIRATLTRRLGYSSWRGPAADRFRHQWTTSARSIDLTAQALREAQKQLAANADQQRQASGVAGSAGSGSLLGGVVRAAEHAIDGERRTVHDVTGLFGKVLHGAERGVGAELRFTGTVFHEARTLAERAVHADAQLARQIISSQEFKDVLEAAQVVSAVAPFVAVIFPPLAPVALTVAAVASVAVLAGDAMQMANTGKWDPYKLAQDGLTAGLSGVGAGAALHLAAPVVSGAHDMNLLTRATEDLRSGQRAVAAVRTVQSTLSVGHGAVTVTQDLHNHDYRQAGLDSVEMVAGVSGMNGAGHQGHIVQNLIDPSVQAEATAVGMAEDHHLGGLGR